VVSEAAREASVSATAEGPPALTIYVASFNTVGYTELCIRSLHHYADQPFALVVGDSESVDGSREMLEAMAHEGWLDLETTPKRRIHWDWLDRWLASARTDYVVFCDSDVQFLRSGFLSDLTRAAERGAVMACERILPHSHYQDWRPATHLMPRPTPWMMLVHAPSLRSLNTSFQKLTEPTDKYPEGQLTYDVGGMLYNKALEAGMRTEALGRSFRRKYRHFGNASWGAREPLPVGRIRRRPAERVLAAGLEEMRRVRTQPSAFHRLTVAA
jgi:glycosyltransferase involved in cell wall biosynthesis